MTEVQRFGLCKEEYIEERRGMNVIDYVRHYRGKHLMSRPIASPSSIRRRLGFPLDESPTSRYFQATKLRSLNRERDHFQFRWTYCPWRSRSTSISSSKPSQDSHPALYIVDKCFLGPQWPQMASRLGVQTGSGRIAVPFSKSSIFHECSHTLLGISEENDPHPMVPTLWPNPYRSDSKGDSVH
jgi:hypothetical protein